SAGIATLTQLKAPDFYDTLDKKADRLLSGLVNAAEKAEINVTGNRVGSMLGLFFTDREVLNFDNAKTCDLEMFSAFYNGMLEKGNFLAPSQFEALFVSAAHDTEHIDTTITAAKEVMQGLRK
ncbi:MAG: aspartate aminotransferase family protein, partial [Deltaproteobacteria bacterium]|nr:aspartate aminotransferase family protein [Deltaproteobacteria bacterium]